MRADTCCIGGIGISACAAPIGRNVALNARMERKRPINASLRLLIRLVLHLGGALFGRTGGLVDPFLCAFCYTFAGVLGGSPCRLTCILGILAGLLHFVFGRVLRKGRNRSK